MGQSRVTLCVFMCMLLSFNPVSVFLSSVPTTSPSLVHSDYTITLKEATKSIQPHHRTLRSSINELSFEDFQKENEEESGENIWWPYIRQAFVWAINSFIVLFVLVRLLIYGESTAWPQFLVVKQQASLGIRLGNYREAQRQLSDSLQVLF